MQISPALPGDAGYVGPAPVMLSAAAADDPTGKGIPGGGRLLHVGLFPVGLQRLPGQSPGLPVNDGRVGILHVILWQLPPVHDLLLGQMIRAEGLLQKGVAHILFVGQHRANQSGRPPAAQPAGDLLPLQGFRDQIAAQTVSVVVKDPAHYGGLLRVDDNPASLAAVAVEQHQVHGPALGEVLAHPPLAVLGYAPAFLLGEESKEGKHQLSVSAQGVQPFLFKEHGNPQLLQFPGRFQQGDGVPGEAAHRLGQDPVDLSDPAVRQQPLKLRPLAPGASVVRIRVAACVGPAGMLLDHLAVIADLPGQGMEHGVLAGGDPGVGGHPEQPGPRRRGCQGMNHFFHQAFRLLSRPYSLL